MLFAFFQPSRVPSPLVPALQQSVLLSVHVAVAIIAYGTFAMGFIAAILYLIKNRTGASWIPELDLLENISYMTVVIGFPFLTATIVLGALWQISPGTLLELGPQGNSQPGNLVAVRRLPPRPSNAGMARQPDCMVAYYRFPGSDIYVPRKLHFYRVTRLRYGIEQTRDNKTVRGNLYGLPLTFSGG